MPLDKEKRRLVKQQLLKEVREKLLEIKDGELTDDHLMYCAAETGLSKKNLEKLLYENDGKPQNPHDATCDFLVKFLEDPLYDDFNNYYLIRAEGINGDIDEVHAILKWIGLLRQVYLSQDEFQFIQSWHLANSGLKKISFEDCYLDIAYFNRGNINRKDVIFAVEQEGVAGKPQRYRLNSRLHTYDNLSPKIIDNHSRILILGNP